MELRHLRYFVAVADECHFTRAAERLGIGQPPLSQQIQALEREVGTKLFKRLPRGVALTDAGQSLLDDARTILADVARAGDHARRAARGELGRVRIGMINSAPFHPFVPRVIREFGQRYPQIALSLEEKSTPALAAAVLDEQVDVAFVRPPLGDDERLTVQALFDEEVLIALPQGHPLAEYLSLPLDALAAEPFVLFPRPVGAGFYDDIISACQRSGFSPRIVQETSQITSIVNLVAAGLGVSVVPASMQQVHSEGVTYRSIFGDRLKARMCLVHRRDEVDSATISNLLGVIEEVRNRALTG
ncbi:LysR family transcriptional regulator [Banduia mediterranea]|uniref:LysR family transcriptional regulator n=1 Tax=Banduia mediterranea TaxID=3075609 RepID=UPI0032C230C7